MLSLLFACPALIGARQLFGEVPGHGATALQAREAAPCRCVAFLRRRLPLLRSRATPQTCPVPPFRPPTPPQPPDALLEPDGLRTISLVARDAAHLASALCARTSDMRDLWTQLARRIDPRLAAAAAPVTVPEGG